MPNENPYSDGMIQPGSPGSDVDYKALLDSMLASQRGGGENIPGIGSVDITNYDPSKPGRPDIENYDPSHPGQSVDAGNKLAALIKQNASSARAAPAQDQAVGLFGPSNADDTAAGVPQTPALQKQQEDAAGRESGVAAQQAQADADKAAEGVIRTKEHQLHLEDSLHQADVTMQHARQQNDEAYERYRGFRFHDYWADKSTGSHVIAAIAVGLGAINGGTNQPLEILKGAITRDFEKQKLNLDSLHDQALMAHTGIADAHTARGEMLKELNLKEAAALDSTAAKYAEQKARLGVPMAQIAGDGNIIAIRQAAEAKRQEADRYKEKQALEQAKLRIEQRRADALMQHYRRGGGGGGASGRPPKGMDYVLDDNLEPKVGPDGKFIFAPISAAKAQNELTKKRVMNAGGTGKAPTESQAKNALLAQQMEGEINTIDGGQQLSSAALDKVQRQAASAGNGEKLASSGVVGSIAARAGRATGIIAKSKYDGLTPGEQTVANAWDNAVEKMARVLTGAGMPADEAQRLALQNQPHAGDSKAIIAQKLQRLRQFAAEQKALSGPAGPLASQAANGAGGGLPQSPGAGYERAVAPDGRRGYYNKTTHKFKAD